ncbi:BTAD domain-containing putative transcriptional regulator [Thermoleptolyngbya sp. C42_A2020_037]|uniref:ATP-binding protein n=1 Tax=Thermoleptolyngbya sp. C42_A2020_037 TaxID=2747799 RepID=UPI0019D9E910|nr:BTAD domain-containing putative transcriptional regulator [Thermoleptolyngbya sp. C42_A2020_037]MBF2084295.1 AAA family ATPase [Thermoleptolyngbya sp. C42_A2020_037]
MPPRLHIKLLGDFAITDERQISLGIGSDRQQALLAYLLLHRRTPQPRQRLAFHLWPDSIESQARSNLRKALSHLRQALPEPDTVLLADAKTLQWSPSASIVLDVAEFENAVKLAAQATEPDIARSHLEAALSLYQGDLLPSCTDEWIEPERDRLQQTHKRALQQTITLLKAQQDYDMAIAYAQQVLRSDPLNESAHTTLMHLHWLKGDRANALQVYHHCMTLLREELGVDPGPTLRKLYDQILNADDEPFGSLAGSIATASGGDRPLVSAALLSPASAAQQLSPLIGRTHEWDTIQQWMGAENSLDNAALDTLRDRPVLLLTGEPGIGKTRLLQAIQEQFQQQNHCILWGRGFEAEIVRPYGVWIDALRAFVTNANVQIPEDLTYLLSESSPSSQSSDRSPSDRSYLFDSVVQFISTLCSSQCSVLIVLDDIQWIDEASSSLLHYAIRLLSQHSVFFACTARTKELDDNAAVLRGLQALRRERRLLTLPLQPLEPEQTAALIRSVYAPLEQDWSPEQTQQVFIDSGGNPLFALEIARAMSSGEATHADSLELLIGDRLQRLDDYARELIPWAAALGRTFDPTTLSDIADAPLSKLLTGIEQLERESLIRVSASHGQETRYDFAHDIVRQVAYRQLSEPRRRLLHLQISQKLHQRASHDSSLAAEIAHHAALGGDRALAATACLAAANYSLKLFAYAEAAELSLRGIQHCQVLDQRTRVRLHIELLQVLLFAGVPAEQVAPLEAEVQELVQEAHRLGLSEAEMAGLEVLMILNFQYSNFAYVQQHSERVVEIGRLANPMMTARALASSGSCLAEVGREMARAEALLEEARSLAARVGQDSADLYGGLGRVRLHTGDYDEGRALLQRAYEIAQQEQDHWRECWVLTYLAMTELEAGNPVAALAYSQAIATVASQIQGQGSEAAVADALTALARYHLQKTDVAAALDQAIAVLRQLDNRRMLSYLLSSAAEVDLASDRPTQAIEKAAVALSEAQAINQPVDVTLAWALLVQGWLRVSESAADRNAVAAARQQASDLFQQFYPQISVADLSRRARAAVTQTRHQMALMHPHAVALEKAP